MAKKSRPSSALAGNSIFAKMPDDEDAEGDEGAYEAWRVRERRRMSERRSAGSAGTEDNAETGLRVQKRSVAGVFYVDEDTLKRDEERGGVDVRRRIHGSDPSTGRQSKRPRTTKEGVTNRKPGYWEDAARRCT